MMLMEMSPLLYDFAMDVAKEVRLCVIQYALLLHLFDPQIQIRAPYSNETVYQQWLRINGGNPNIGERFL